MLPAFLAALCLCPAVAAPAAPGSGEDERSETRAEIESFLLAAEVVARKPLGSGVTRSDRLQLSRGDRTAYAVWKTIDDYQPFKRFHDRGLPEVGFRDSYKSEIAAYELDKVLELGMVPPTVERRIDNRRGSLQLWIDGCISEAERRRGGLEPPNGAEWGAQTYRYRVFHQLTHDTDYLNLSNLLIEKDTFRIWVIDHSRAFRTQGRLLETTYLRRFSRPLLERVRALDRRLLEDRLGRWLTGPQIKGLLARRDLIVAHADALVAERGADAVLYD